MATYTGEVVKETYARGSKSERDAVMLQTESGRFLLRRSGVDQLQDPGLDVMVGKKVNVEGDVLGQLLLMKSWQERK